MKLRPLVETTDATVKPTMTNYYYDKDAAYRPLETEADLIAAAAKPGDVTNRSMFSLLAVVNPDSTEDKPIFEEPHCAGSSRFWNAAQRDLGLRHHPTLRF